MEELIDEVHVLITGGRMRAGIDEPSDDDAIVLGAIASDCQMPGDSTSFYRVEQELKGVMTRLAMNVANRRLLRLGLIEISLESEWNGNEIKHLSLSEKGEAWIETHQKRIAALMDKLKPAPALTAASQGGMTDDDIPF